MNYTFFTNQTVNRAQRGLCGDLDSGLTTLAQADPNVTVMRQINGHIGVKDLSND